MQFIDLAKQQSRLRDKIEANIRAVLDHGKYIMGPEVGALEKQLAEYAQTRYAISCSSGTDAILLSLMALGVEPGDAVFTTPCTFIATAEVISLLGATPIFVDVEKNSFNLAPDKLDLAISSVKARKMRTKGAPLRPRGIIAVDLFGLPADYEGLRVVANKHNLFLLGDAAQSFGAEIDGKKACSFPDVTCTSFFPAKPLGCYGDGGMCFTDDEHLADVISSLRLHGKGSFKYDNVRIGVNARLDTIQAGILLAKFEIYPEEISLRQEVAGRYSQKISDLPGLTTPHIPEGYLSAWAQYSILATDSTHRQKLRDCLGDAGIPTVIYYPKPLHLQTAFASLGYQEGDFPVGESCFDRIFSLPMHPYLSEGDQDKIVEILSSVS